MHVPENLFAAEHYAPVRAPLLEAQTLPPWCYTSDAFYRREVERIFMKVWNFVGRAERAPSPGDYFTLDFCGVPVLLVRGDDGELRAFANVCRHRSARLLEGAGNCRAIRCPYHSWTYALDGSLMRAPQMEQTVSFDPASSGLKPIRLSTWDGFVFLNFDDDAAPLADWLGDLPSLMAPYRFEDMVCTRVQEYDLACNWKVYVENAMESYHVPTVHMKTLQPQRRDHNPPIESGGEYCGLFTRHTGSRALLPGAQGFPFIPSLSGLTAEGSYYVLIHPSTMFGCTFDCMWWLEMHPQGPASTRLLVGSCFPRETTECNDFEQIAANYYERWDISIPEDNVISDQQQRGLASPHAEPGRFSFMEPLVHEIDNWVLDRVL